jgi:hypothetical protein
MTRPFALLWLASSSLLPVAAAQSITFAEGAASSLTIAVVSEASPLGSGQVLLTDVELLPIEITGRTLAQDQDRTRSRRLTRHGLTRVELPGGGRLFRYRRGGGQHWGFLRIQPDGAPAVLLERPGVGSLLADPFLDRIGVAADGRHAAMALLGGGLYLVRLDGGVFASSGSAARLAVPTTTVVVPTSVMVGDSVVWYQSTTERVFRCGLADGAQPVDVSAPLQPNAIHKDQMAMTRDGSRLVFLYGPQNNQQLWTVGLSGAASPLPLPAGKYEEPGYLPEDPGEPAMLLNEAGTRLFCIESAVRDELQLLDLQGGLPTLAITESAIFQPYIGSHILPQFAADQLVVAIGDPAQMDWFRAALAPTGGTVVNLTGTGSLQQPFPSGTLDPVAVATAGGAMFLTEQGTTGLALRRLDPASGATQLIEQGLLAPPVLGDAAGGSADLVVASANGDRLYHGPSGALFAAVPPGLTLGATAHGPLFQGTTLGFPGGFGIVALYLHDGTVALGQPEAGLRQVALTAQGGVVVVGAAVRYFAVGASFVLNRPVVAARWCLSGAGA